VNDGVVDGVDVFSEARDALSHVCDVHEGIGLQEQFVLVCFKDLENVQALLIVVSDLQEFALKAQERQVDVVFRLALEDALFHLGHFKAEPLDEGNIFCQELIEKGIYQLLERHGGRREALGGADEFLIGGTVGVKDIDNVEGVLHDVEGDVITVVVVGLEAVAVNGVDDLEFGKCKVVIDLDAGTEDRVGGLTGLDGGVGDFESR